MDREWHDPRRVQKAAWRALGHPDPTPVQYDMMAWMHWGGPKVAVHGFRGVAKSMTLGVYCAFCLGMAGVWARGCDCPACAPLTRWNGRLVSGSGFNILILSAGKDLAAQFTTHTRGVLRATEPLRHLLPRRGQRDATDAFDVSTAPEDPQHPSVKAVGIFGGVVGSRGDLIAADDVEVPRTTETVGMREKLRRQLSTQVPAVLKPGGRVIVNGTYQHEESVYRELPGKGYSVRVWPVHYPGRPPGVPLERHGDALAPMLRRALAADPELAGTPTAPTHFPEEAIEEKRQEMRKADFLLQFELDTTEFDKEQHPLRVRDLVVMNLDTRAAPSLVTWCNDPRHLREDIDSPGFAGDLAYGPLATPGQYQPYEASVLWVDPSGRGKDETAWAVVKLLAGSYFLLACRGDVRGYDDPVLERIARDALFHGVDRIVYEDNLGLGMFGKLLAPVARKRGWGGGIEPTTSRGQKEKRILEALEPVTSAHRLIVDAALFRHEASPDTDPEDKRYRLWYQYTRLSDERGSLPHDDRIEAVGGAVATFAAALESDRETRAQELQDEEFGRLLEDMAAELGPGPPARAPGIVRQRGRPGGDPRSARSRRNSTTWRSSGNSARRPSG